MTSDVLTQGQIYDAADAVISQRLSQIQGVGGVNVNGSALPAVRVEINPQSLSKYGIGLQDVRAAISNANANAPKGAIESDRLHYQIYTNDNARDAAPYRNLIIANRNGATVRLGDVAEVLDMQDGATENIRTYGLYNGKPAVSVQVFQQPGANIIEMVDARQGGAAASSRPTIDPKIDLVGDLRSLGHDPRLAAPGRGNAGLAVLMVILVVYIFLNSYRAALIPAVVVPVSLIGTFGAMYLLGYTLDNFSLMALTIATGFVVDDAIVVMENTTRHIEARHAAHAGRAARRARSRLHGGLDEPVAGRRVHPVHVDRRHRRAAVPRVHGDAVGRDPDLAGDLPDHDADDVLAPARVATASKQPAPLARHFERGFDALRQRI